MAVHQCSRKMGVLNSVQKPFIYLQIFFIFGRFVCCHFWVPVVQISFCFMLFEFR
jgi:hypothetical protein